MLARDAEYFLKLQTETGWADVIPGGRVAVLNPSEALNEQAALRIADEKCLQGVARDTLLNWARQAEQNHHRRKKELSLVP